MINQQEARIALVSLGRHFKYNLAHCEVTVTFLKNNYENIDLIKRMYIRHVKTLVILVIERVVKWYQELVFYFNFKFVTTNIHNNFFIFNSGQMLI